jgi:CRISPR-associated protein Cas1
MAANDWGTRMELLVEQPGTFVGRKSERIRVSMKGETLDERPLYGLEGVLIASNGVSLSSDIVRECAERGIPIHFLSRSGAPYARLIAPGLTGTVRTRREQLLASGDGRGLALAKAFATGKLANQANLLRYMAKNRREEADLFENVREAAFRIQEIARRLELLEGGTVDALREDLLSLEARAAREYWDACRQLLSEPSWESRETRGATDLVNVLLNYGYGCLYGKVEQAALLAGLDPYAGFVHTDRAGKPSLVLDLIEEFRQPVVDRTVFALLRLGVVFTLEEGRLDAASRRRLAEKLEERLEGTAPHEGKQHKLKTILQMQARRIATFVRGEAPYKPFISRW